jgi:exonuclease SbcC
VEDQVEWMKKRLERSTKMREALANDEKGLRTYSQLAADLRSDKFQAYVLEEAFTELVQGASARLRSLTGERYALLFKDGKILVVDNDNAGETRISDTLSGGETFLTSLSLALELSDQVQRAAGAVNLDSLFIDEGFGTLDPDTLALVSETIQNLRVGGRMVGIITHIPELRDEFAQQIIVTKHQGYSTVEVRGVTEEVAGA